MSKMTQAIAILGVVAGLGVTALPLSTYAANPVVWDKTSAESSDIKNIGGSGSSAFVSTDTTINLTIEDKLSIASTAESVTLSSDNTNGDATKKIWAANPINVTVLTKNAGGYKLTVAGAASGVDFNNPVKDNDLTNETGDAIAAGMLGDEDATSSWGIKAVAGSGDSIVGGTVVNALSDWSKVPASTENALLIMSSSKPTVDAGETAAITFGAKVVDGQAAGTYKGKVTFTATNQPKSDGES